MTVTEGSASFPLDRELQLGAGIGVVTRMTQADEPSRWDGTMKEIGQVPSEAVLPWNTVEARAAVDRMRTWT